MDGIISIKRDCGGDPDIVRITTTSTLAQVAVAGYITAQYDNILISNSGQFTWLTTDTVLLSASNGWGLYSISSDFSSLNSLFVSSSANNAFSGSNTFSGTNTFSGSTIFTGITSLRNIVIGRTTAQALATNTGTLTATQLLRGNLLFTPTGNATWTFPLGADIDTALASPNSGTGITQIILTNNSAFNITFNANTGISFSGLSTPGTLSLGPNSTVTILLNKISVGSYTVYGSSGSRTIRAAMSLMIGNAANLTYSVIRMPFPGKLLGVSSIDQSGTCTATFSINATTVTSTPLAVSPVNATAPVTGNNTFVAGDYINVTITDNVTATRVLFSVEYQYTTLL